MCIYCTSVVTGFTLRYLLSVCDNLQSERLYFDKLEENPVLHKNSNRSYSVIEN